MFIATPLTLLFPPFYVGFRFLVMERMQAPLSEVVSILLESNSSARGIKKIPMGDVAIAMLNCIQAMHDNGNLFVDVKPENFMLSSTSAAAASKRSKSDVSQRIRLIDFGLVERFDDMCTAKRREDAYPNAPLVGTPTYASLHVMSGHTASRRDDVEALGYVICELILMMASSGTTSSGSGRSKTKNDNNILPWSHAASDDELYRIKSQEMDESKRSKSNLFARLKTTGTDTVMGNYFSAVLGLAYSEKPDYESLRRNLEKLVVAVDSTSSGSVSAKKTATKATTSPVRKARASARAVHHLLDDDNNSADSIQAIDENTENCKPPSDKRQKRSVAKEGMKLRTAGRTTRDVGTQSNEIGVIDVDAINDDDDDAMDWDPVESTTINECNTTTTADKCILTLDFIEGPHKGQSIPFGGNRPSTVCIGRDPASRAMKDTIKFALSNDKSVSPVHAKFVLNSKSTVHSVRVTDMSSTSGTIINGISLPSGKSKQAFLGDKIKIGGTLIEIRKA